MSANVARTPFGVSEFVSRIEENELERLQAQPGFIEAVRSSAAGGVELYRNAPVLNAIVNDRGRLIISSMALYLHFLSEQDPSVALTAGRLKAIAVEQGVCSAGRAAAVVALMRWGGYLAPAAPKPGERWERLVVTPKLLATIKERWAMQLTVMSRLLPEAQDALEHLDDPRFVAAYSIAQGEHFFAGFRFVDYAPEIAVFGDRNAGLLILLSFVAQGASPERAAPETVNVSISALARRFGVSRPHVISVLRDAQQAGLIEREGEEVRISERLSRAVERFHAVLYLFNLYSVRRGLQACSG